ncbi:MAG: hypothetical protein NVV68_06745 [Dokdonella sp.]|nr:hypothetical protein [Dokdonella sp.]
MIVWLRIAGAPVRQFYGSPDALPHLDGSAARHALLLGVGEISSSLSDELPKVTVTLDNRSGQCTRLFAVPPLGAPAELLSPDGTEFAGAIQSVRLTETECQLGLEA